MPAPGPVPSPIAGGRPLAGPGPSSASTTSSAVASCDANSRRGTQGEMGGGGGARAGQGLLHATLPQLELPLTWQGGGKQTRPRAQRRLRTLHHGRAVIRDTTSSATGTSRGMKHRNCLPSTSGPGASPMGQSPKSR
jgi:hypothetical protein